MSSVATGGSDSAETPTGVSRKRFLTKSPGKTIENISKCIKKEQHNQTTVKIVEALERDSELCNYVAYIIDSGKLKENNDPKQLPAASNKFKLISMATKEHIIQKIWPLRLSNQLNMKDLKAKDKQFPQKVLMFALGIDLRCAVFSKNIGALMDKCMERYHDMGRRLEGMQIKDDVLDWPGCGVYQFQPKGAKHYTHIKSVHGETAELESVGHGIDDTWSISKNHDVEKAALQKGKITLKLFTLFAKDQQERMRPLALARVPSSNGGVAGSSVSMGSARSFSQEPMAAAPAATGGSPTPPPGDGNALAE
jgi:hypothetical protein